MSEDDEIGAWIAAARAGDRVALAKLLAAYHPQWRARVESRLHATVRPRVSPEDILQETYIDVARQMPGFVDRGPDSFAHWVQTILDHKLIDAERAAHCRARDVGREVAGGSLNDDSYWNLLDHLAQDSATPSHVIRRQEALTALRTSIADLPEVQRQVVEWHYLEGLPVRTVADRLGRSDEAVVALGQRALHELRRLVDLRGEFTRGD